MRTQGVSLFVGLLACIFIVPTGACVGDEVMSGPTTPTPDGGSVPGTTCGAGNACANNASCVDGFCCDSACTGTCEACNVAGQEGRCSAVKGVPLHGVCDGDAKGACAGSCDGVLRAACTYPSDACGTPACAGGTATLPAACKAGACQPAEKQQCALGCLQDGCLGVKHVAGGRAHACAVMTDKHLRCWGTNDYGQLGPNALPVGATPEEVPSFSSVEMVAATAASTCVLLTDKTVKCMGSNGAGELGLGTADSNFHATPTTVPGLTDVVFLGGSSGGHFCAITTGGGVKCWGSNAAGQLGDGTLAAVKGPVTVCQPGAAGCVPSSGATVVAGGDGHTCAAFAGGKVACWGANQSGEIGQAPLPGGGVPNPVPTFVGNLTATTLTAGNHATCAASDGGAKCFGENGLGVLGNGKVDVSSPTPQSVCTNADCTTRLTGVTGVTTFDDSACALADGAVKCWGTNSGGQLGDGNATASQSYAATTAIAAGAVFVASSGPMNFAIVVDRANRDLLCWGSEFGSECGSGLAPGKRTTPIRPKW